MPRRNIVILLAFTVVSLLCCRKVQTNRYGRILANAYDTIERRYLTPVEPYDLFEGAMEGMVDRLPDRYSTFESPKKAEELDESLRQEFGGLGIQITIDPKTKFVTVVIPLFDTPAQKAGIRAGDKILRIDDHSTQGLSLDDVKELLRGKPGEPVTLSILHEGAEEPVDIGVVRDIIPVASVLGDTRNPDGSWNYFLEGRDRIAYVRIQSFGEKTLQELRDVLDELLKNDMQGLILDLRDNRGGLLTAATDICNMFVGDGVIVTIRGRDKRVRQTYKADPKDTYPDFPIAVIVNQHSASASEIVAACLQDLRRAAIVGQRTWGKGTVQDVIQLEENKGVLKLTTASYWRPSEKNIDKESSETDGDWGVVPDEDCEVVVKGDELVRFHQWRRQRDSHLPQAGDETSPNGEPEPFVDRPLQRALKYVEKKLGQTEYFDCLTYVDVT